MSLAWLRDPGLLATGRKNIAGQPRQLRVDFSLNWLALDFRPWNLHWLELEGLEYVWFYLWLIKDMAWNQCDRGSLWYYPGWLFGVGSVCWGGLVILSALRRRQWSQAWLLVGEELWLLGNWVWMRGEIHDLYYLGDWHRDYNVATKHAEQLFYAGIAWITTYYVFLRPLGVFEGSLHPSFTDRSSDKSDQRNFTRLQPRYRWYMRDWTEYWFLHVFCWLGKDLGWAVLAQELWIIGLFATLCLALDYCNRCTFRRARFFHFCHYAGYFFWISGNAIWACGDEFFDPFAEPKGFSLDGVPPDLKELRWWGGWLFVTAWVCVGAAWIDAIVCLLFGFVLDPPSEEDFIEQKNSPAKIAPWFLLRDDEL